MSFEAVLTPAELSGGGEVLTYTVIHVIVEISVNKKVLK